MPWEFTCRPILRGQRGMVTAGHYLAAMAGFSVLCDGGNAIDAAVAAGLAESLVEPHQNGLGGENPMIVWPAAAERPVVLSGQGWAPSAATPEAFHALGVTAIPGDGYLAACVPAAVSTYLTALIEFGTKSLAQVAAPALYYARHGFQVATGMAENIDGMQARFAAHWPTSAETYLRDGFAPLVGDLFTNTAWADTMDALIRAESECGGKRLCGLHKAHDCFYRGEVADRIGAALASAQSLDASGSSHGPLLCMDDFDAYETRIEEPVSLEFHGARIFKCDAWSQGPVFLQQLGLLLGYDLVALGHNTPEYLHTLIECAKLAFADRERFYGDPLFSEIPMETLLSEDYNERQRAFIDPEAAIRVPLWDTTPGPVAAPVRGPKPMGGDTTHVDTADAAGNMVSLTPSGGWLQSSPVLRGLGFPLGTRAQMFRLTPGHPNALEPRKRPRTTLTPAMAALPEGRRLAFGTPGGDGQDQWTLQFLLNHLVFGMDLQTALEAPTVHSRHFPSSFYPHEALTGTMVAESRIPADVRDALRSRGHDVTTLGPWENGRALAISWDNGSLTAGVSPRHETAYAAGW
jgi:gamma-glutamyltranspeptidase / glutathione hydrolase